MHRKTIICCLLLSPFYSAIADISSNNYLKNFEISLGAGEAFFSSNNGSLQVSSSETDSLSVSSAASNPIEKIGLGYYFFQEQTQRKFFPDLLAQINIYHVNSSINGSVFQYGQSSLNDYTFSAPLSSTRLMLDFKPTLFTYHHLSPYVTGGIGFAWNKISYNETTTDTSIPSNSFVTLDTGLNRRFAYDLGFGVNYHVTSHFNTSLEYLYNRIGNVNTSTSGSNQGVYSPASFSVRSQNVLLNVSYQF